MANNSLPRSVAQVISMATKMHQGLITLGATLKITQITPLQFNAELQAVIVADGDFNAARSAKQTASDAFKPADIALAEWLQVTRNVLAARFGNRWSTMWAQAGFTDATTAVPARIADRFGLALSLANFFTANPSYEVASMNVTATQATTLRNAAVTAQQAFIDADVALKSKGDAWDSAFATLTETMRSLINILRATLESNDPRWLVFGLAMPSTNTTPGQPENVTVTLDETGALVVQCTAVPLAMRYRWRMLLVGIETEYRLVARSVDPIGTITGVLPGQTVQIIVQAVNGGSQGIASEPVRFTMPTVARGEPRIAPAMAAPATALDEVVISSNGNGSTGHTNGSRLPALA